VVRDDRERTITEVEIPVRTIVRVILVFSLLWLVGKLWDLMLLGVIALMFTAAIHPWAVRLQNRGWSRARAVTVITATIIAVVALAIALVIPPLIIEGQEFLDELPNQVDRLEDLVGSNPELFDRLREAAENPGSNAESVEGPAKEVGLGIVNFIADALIVIVFTIYFLLDGDRIYRWTVRYFPQRYRRKLDRTIPEVSRVIGGYAAGQFVTSALFGTFAFILLLSLGVPQPLFLAILAAIGDAIPIVGVTAVTIPTVLLALTVSPTAAIIVIAAYLIYQQIENYIVVPRVYKTTLNISSFSVLLAVLVGSALLGIVGALLALPIASAIPVIEDIWLEDNPIRNNLPPEDPPQLDTKPL
jgi:predicted PurR-regulated permease PerM